MKWEKVENDRGKQGAFRDISLVHRKKNCEFTFHRQRDGKKKGGKGSVKGRSRLMNFVKRTSKRENTIENHALPPVHVQWKEENQYKNESLFSTWGRRGKRSTLYIFSQFHSLSVEADRYPLSAGEFRSEGETSDRQTSDIRNSVPESKRAPQAPIYIAPEGRHHHPQRQSRCRPLSEANITCRRQAATTLGPKGRQP